MRTLQSQVRLTYLLRTVLPTTAYLLPIFGLLILLCVVWPIFMARDTQKASHRTAEAKAIAVTYVSDNRFFNPYNEVTLRLAEGKAIGPCNAPVHVGDRVWVVYRVGQSGRIYVDDIKQVRP